MPRTASIFLCLLFAGSAPAEAGQHFVRSQILMGDVPVTLTVETSASRREQVFEAMEEAFEEARRLENSLSEWRDDSQATLLNRHAGKALVPVDREMTDLLGKARKISEMTGGAFDITFPSRKKGINYRDVVVLPELGLAYLRPGAKIGVSGIAKGFIVDAMAGILGKSGFRKFLVDAGDLYASGRWKIGIRNPDRPGSDEALCEIAVKNRAVSTSGLYERGAHIVDPRTGRHSSGLKSVTVVASDSATSDALATAFFVLGPEESNRILEAHREIKAIFVRSDTSSPPRCAPAGS